jgi:hypothetical protein
MLNVFTKKSKIVFFLTIFITTISFAQSRGGSKFSAGIMAMLGTGKMGNGLSDAMDRDMLYTPIGLFAGFNIKKFRIGVNYEYMLTGQTTEPGSVGDGNINGTNLSGTTTAPGIRLEFYDGKQSFGLIYRLSSEHKLDKATAAGTTATYKGSGGFSIQYVRQLKNKMGLVIDYTTETFNDSLSTGNVKWNRIGLGVVFSNFTGRGR